MAAHAGPWDTTRLEVVFVDAAFVAACEHGDYATESAGLLQTREEVEDESYAGVVC